MKGRHVQIDIVFDSIKFVHVKDVTEINLDDSLHFSAPLQFSP